jgi:lipopolysaccharide/colanic/teichoic acid biosynthesis glycosyltransferase
LILIDSKGGIFFTQNRVGKNNKDFKLLKFRTMKNNSEKKGQLTIGSKDTRITKIGYYLRKFKIDEIPQVLNVLKGDMSLVGPRPEVRKYVDKYSDYQKQVLNVKPGITDFASIEYFNENEILSKSENPEETYIQEIMPHKIELNLEFINNPSLKNYFLIISKTLKAIFI